MSEPLIVTLPLYFASLISSNTIMVFLISITGVLFSTIFEVPVVTTALSPV